jgi:pyrroline-5-carboxylate reductase
MATAFIGGGNMATALIGGMLARGAAAADFRVVEPYPEARAKLAARFEGVALHATCTREAIAGAALVVLAVKPQQMKEAARSLAPHLASAPAAVVLSISGAFAAASVDAAGRSLVSSVLAAAGEQIWLDDEAMLDAVTAVSGSGPAYVFYLQEALEAAARELGFSAPVARRLAQATLSGAVALSEASPAEPAILRAQVTSKGGTTERAIAVMEDGAVKATIVAAVKAAALRAAEMGDAFGADS